MTSSHSPDRPAVVDAHVDLYDSRANRYGIFERRDPVFEALFGDYAALRPNYFLDAYVQATPFAEVEGVVWDEFISADPPMEMAWAEKLGAASEAAMALVGLVDFADTGLSHRLDVYRSIPVATFSDDERDAMFRTTALKWFPGPDRPA